MRTWSAILVSAMVALPISATAQNFKFRQNPTGHVMTDDVLLEASVCEPGNVAADKRPILERMCRDVRSWQAENVGRPREQWTPLRWSD